MKRARPHKRCPHGRDIRNPVPTRTASAHLTHVPSFYILHFSFGGKQFCRQDGQDAPKDMAIGIANRPLRRDDQDHGFDAITVLFGWRCSTLHRARHRLRPPPPGRAPRDARTPIAPNAPGPRPTPPTTARAARRQARLTDLSPVKGTTYVVLVMDNVGIPFRLPLFDNLGS